MVLTQKQAEKQVRKEKERAPVGSGKRALSEEGIRREASSRVQKSKRRGATRIIGPTPPEKAKRILEQTQKNLQTAFARANLRGDIVKKGSFFVPTNRAGQRIASQISSVSRLVRSPIPPSRKLDLFLKIGEKGVEPEIFEREKGRRFDKRKLRETGSQLTEQSLKELSNISKLLIKKQVTLGIVKKRQIEAKLKAFDKRILSKLSTKERKVLINIEKSSARQLRFEQSINRFYSENNLSIRQGDKVLTLALKGTAQLGFGLINLPGFIGSAIDKALIAIQALSLKHFRRTTKKELSNTFKKVPRVVWEQFDPRKPENWANILLIAFGVKRAKRGVLKEKITASQAKKLKVPSNVAKRIVKKSDLGIARLTGKVVKSEVRFLKKKVNKRINVLSNQLKKVVQQTTTVRIAKRTLRASKKQLFKARTTKEIARITARLNKNKLLKSISERKAKIKKPIKKLRKAIKTTKAIARATTKLRASQISKSIKQFKNIPLTKLQSLKKKLKVKSRRVKTSAEIIRITAQLKTINIVIKYKTALNNVSRQFKSLQVKSNALIKSAKAKLKLFKRRTKLSVQQAKILKDIKQTIRRIKQSIRVIKSKFTRVKTTGEIIKLTTQLRINKLLNPLKNNIRRLELTVRQVKTLVKKKVSKVKKRIRVTGKVAKAILARPGLAIKARLIRQLRKRGVTVGKPRRRFLGGLSVSQAKLRVFTKKGVQTVTLNKGSGQASINIGNNGVVTIFQDVPVSTRGGQIVLQRVKLKTLQAPSFKSLQTSRGFSSFINNILPIASVALKNSSRSATKLLQKPQIKSAIKAKFKTKQEVTIKQKSKVAQRQALRVKQAQKQAVALRSRQITRITPRIRARLRKSIPFKFRKKIRTDKEKKELIKWLRRQPKVFRPSLVAILFNITGFKIPTRLTGLEIRPIIIRRPKRVKQKRKARRRKK